MKSIAEMYGMEVLQRETAVCDKHGPFERRRVRVAGREVEWGCPKCDRDKADEEYAELRRQQQVEARQRRIEAMFERAAIPKRFQGRTFANYSAQNQGQATALRMCQEYADQFDKAMADGRCLVLSGTPGTGKTHLACSIIRQVIDAGHSALFIGALEAIKRIRATWGGNSMETEAEVVGTLRDVDLLVLDEIGVQFGTDAEQTQLFEIINGRYMDMKPTIIISNLAAPQLEAVLGSRAFDRLREGGGRLVKFDWDSHRGSAS